MLSKDLQTFDFWRRARREILYAFCIGSVPIIICSTASELSDMVNTLLTPAILMGYYTAILCVFAVVSIILLKARFRSPACHRAIRSIHAFLVNIGGSLLVAFRAALGAMIGYLVVWACQDPETMTPAGVLRTGIYTPFTLGVCVMLAWMDEALRNPHAMSRYS